MGVDTEQSLRDALAAALAEANVPDLALLTGDLVQDATPETYDRLATILAALPCPAYCLPGNHDEPRLMAERLGAAGIHTRDCIETGGWRIVCLDSTVPRSPGGRLADAELEKLERLLAEDGTSPTLIALHHHPIPSNSAWMDTMQLENAPAFFAALERHSCVRGVIFGHVHQAMDATLNGLRLLGTPSTCFQFKPLQTEFSLDAVPAGYRWIELGDDGHIDTRMVRLPTGPAGLDIASAGY
jgi:Icc protein